MLIDLIIFQHINTTILLLLGIGLAIVNLLLKDESKPRIVGVSRTEAALKELEEKNPGRFAYVAGDLANEEITKTVIKKAIDTYGHIHGVILNAGILEPVASIADANIAEWRKLYEINILSPLDLASKAIPYLRNTKGRVVFVSSGASVSNYHGWGAYGSSKAAINHIASSIADEEPDVFAVSIAPGIVDTSMQTRIREERKYRRFEIFG